MPELRKRRSHLALLGVFAMVASVLAVGASPASATPGKADGAAGYSACVGPAAADAGFTDVAAGSTHDAAINCVAYYGITRGTSASTFSPNRTIPRWQLAVMLQRASGPAGVDLPDAAAQGFTDISELNAAFQAAINQMAALGIMTGTTTTTFDPDGVVSRTTIVEALAGFLTSARVGPGGKALTRNLDRSLTLRQSAARNALPVTLDETFRDIGGVSYSAYQSIRALAEMGVVSGRDDGTFGPAASVTRGQAASFITRALAHTNARPAGLTMQTNTAAVAGTQDIELAVSLRGNDFSPQESAAVDVFYHLTENAATAFKTDGTCQTSGSNMVNDARGAGGACVLEVDDAVTEPDGNLIVEVDAVSRPTTYWAWTGAVGDKLDWNKANLSMDNSDVSNAASVSVSTVVVATKAKVTTSVSGDAENDNTVRYGTTVTVTIQLVDANDKNVAVAGKSYQWWATGVHSPNPDRRPIPGTGTRTVTTGADGSVSFTLTQSDPDTNANVDGPGEDGGADDTTTWTYYIDATGTAAVNPVANTDIGFTVSNGQGQGTLVFEDDQSVAQTLTVELARPWSPKPASGTTGRVGVTAKITDQYGSPQRGHDVYFDLVNNTDSATDFGCSTRGAAPEYLCTAGDTTIDAEDKVAGTVRRVTRSSGTNTVSAVYRATASATAEATSEIARYTVGSDLNQDGNLDGANEKVTVLHFWTSDPTGWNADDGTASPVGFDTSGDDTSVRYVDLANNAIIVGDLMAYRYSADDIFIWYIAADGSFTPPSDIATDANTRWFDAAEFERRMGLYLQKQNVRTNLGTLDLRALRMEIRVRNYNTRGRSVFEIKLDYADNVLANGDLLDPPSN